MSNFEFLGKADLSDLNAQIAASPHLWNQHGWRKRTGSPHTEMSDIWVRFAENPDDVAKPHFAKWYPAYYELPALKPLIFGAMAKAEASHLGGVLITRIPPHGKIDAHVDRGWHPEFYNYKAYFVLQSNDACEFWIENERQVMKQGEVWRINNLAVHGVDNNGDTERQTLIVCMRKDG